MKSKNILLTFIRFDGYQAFNWFSNINEVNKFITKYEKVIREVEDCIEITNSKNIINKLDKTIQEKFILEKDENGWFKK